MLRDWVECQPSIYKPLGLTPGLRSQHHLTQLCWYMPAISTQEARQENVRLKGSFQPGLQEILH